MSHVRSVEIYRDGMQNVSPIQREHKRCVVIAGEAQRNWARLKKLFNKSPDMVLLRTSSLIEDVLEECRKLVPCLLLADYEFIKKLDRPAEFAQKVEFGRLIPVLVLVEHESTETLELLLRMGCMGFLRNTAPSSHFRRAIEAVAAGEVWAPRKLLSRMFQDFLSTRDLRRIASRLTSRESEILALVAKGYTNKETAEALCISRETVRWHMRMVYGKLGVHDRQSAAASQGLEWGTPLIES
jgi:DNA-binding NarL/FixJ family response regulator